MFILSYIDVYLERERERERDRERETEREREIDRSETAGAHSNAQLNRSVFGKPV